MNDDNDTGALITMMLMMLIMVGSQTPTQLMPNIEFSSLV